MGEWIIMLCFWTFEKKVGDVFAWFQKKVGFRTLKQNAVFLTRSGPFWRLMMHNPKSKTKQNLRFWGIICRVKSHNLSLNNYPLKPDVLQCWKGLFLRISGDLLGVIVDGFCFKMWLHSISQAFNSTGHEVVSGRIRRLWTGVFASGRFPGTLKSGLRWAPMVRLHCYRLPWPRRLISAQSHDSRHAPR